MIELAQIVEVRVSPDGRYVAYAVREYDIATNGVDRSFWLWHSGSGEQPVPIDERASHLRWRPDGAAISYLAPDSADMMQVWEYDLSAGSRKLTSHSHSLSSYEWSHDGRRLAFGASRVLVDTTGSLAAGVVIDSERFFYTRLLSGKPLRQADSHYGDPRARSELWVYDLQLGKAWLASDSLSVSAYAWSPDGRRLAMTGSSELGRLPGRLASHDLVLYGVDAGSLRVLEHGSGGDYYDDTVIYDQPFWSPDGTRIGYFRTDLRDRWEGSPQLGIYSLSDQRTVLFLSDDEFETYAPRAFWLHPDTVLIENTHSAGRRLFAVGGRGGAVVPVVDSEDWFDRHSFSRDGKVVAFVRERVETPPEVYISDRGMREARRVTDLNAALDDVEASDVKRIHWPGEDGIEVEGWLYVPPGRPPFPMIVFVHGGPNWVFRNGYEPYVNLWPHAFGVYAANGLAVFAPNYRGTGSYGKEFRRRSALDGEPIRDIIAGIEVLIDDGIADPRRLGIAGHSHGCWLGALVAVRYRRFAAAACAEGMANWASSYQRNAGWMNSEIVEHYWGDGAPPYTNPDRYRELAPVFGFSGLQTPFLFEFGERSLAIAGLEYATAAWRAGLAHELVIYRGTGHNVREPRVMLEAMERNVDWFEFWLLGRRESKNESKRDQYERWQSLPTNVGWGTDSLVRPPTTIQR